MDAPPAAREYGFIMQTTAKPHRRKCHERKQHHLSQEESIFGISAMAAMQELLSKHQVGGITIWQCEDESLITYSLIAGTRQYTGSNLAMTIMEAAGRMVYQTCAKCKREVPMTGIARRSVDLDTLSNICHTCNRTKATTACAATRQKRKRSLGGV